MRNKALLFVTIASMMGMGIAGWYLKKIVKTVISRKQVFSIAMYAGSSPLNLVPIRTRQRGDAVIISSHQVTDTWADFVADPFFVRDGSHWYLFFEIWNKRTRRGTIGLATSTDGLHWKYDEVVLDEPFHLSYPQVFSWEGQWYMVPESGAANAVRLYRANNFPKGWSLATTLLDGDDFLDPTLFYHNHRWWMLTTKNSHDDNLYLFFADHLMGPWQEHPKSPIIQGNTCYSRPAGRVIHHNNQIIRFSQSCTEIYGKHVYAFVIKKISPTDYEETLVQDTPILRGSGRGWNASGMHHIDAMQMDNGQWIACVDGWKKHPYFLDRKLGWL